MLKKSITVIIFISIVFIMAGFFLRTIEKPPSDNVIETERNEYQNPDDLAQESPDHLSEIDPNESGLLSETSLPESTDIARSSVNPQDGPHTPVGTLEEYLETVDPSLPDGNDLGQEKFIGILNDMLRLRGVSPPERPYWARLKEIHSIVEERGYKREELYGFFRPILREMGENIIEYLQQATKTYELAVLFQNNQHTEIEQWVQERLLKNKHDIPALLVQMELLYSVYTMDEFFDAIENFVIGLDNFEPKGVDKRALLYRVLRMGMVWGSTTADNLEREKKKPMQRHLGPMSPGLAEFLCRLEIAGDW